MGRSQFRLFAFAVAAPLLAACGGSHTSSPALPTLPASASSQQPAALTGIPTTSLGDMGVYVHLPLRNSDELDSLTQQQGDKNSPEYHRFLTPGQFRARYGATAADLANAESALKSLGFRTATTSQGVYAAGAQSTIERAFNVHLRVATDGIYRSQNGAASRVLPLTLDRAPTLPASLSALGAKVVFRHPGMHVDSRRIKLTGSPDNRYAAAGTYWFTDLKQAYRYPAYGELNGAGSTIGIVISSDVSDFDTNAFFSHEKLATPVIERRPVNGGKPFDPTTSDSFEASLDVQQSLGSAPGAHLLLYNIKSLFDDDILAGYQAVVDDNRADIVSSSFGQCELDYTAAYNSGVDYTYYLEAYHDIFRQGNAQGITFVASSGDNGAYECTDPTGTTIIKGVSTPAIDSAVTAVGGTNLLTTFAPPSKDSAYVSENAFGDTYANRIVDDVWGSGGGVSQLVRKPWYQNLVNTGARMRTNPDVSMQMGGCPQLPCDQANRSATVEAFDVADLGYFVGAIGTSSSSPEFAGLLAVTEQNLRTRLGNANGYIYLLAAFDGDIYHHRIPGNNGNPTHPGYPSGGAYNYVVGNGTPRAAAFALDPDGPFAGTPQTPSNP